VIIPQRLAAQFWRMNSSAACFSCPVTERTNQPSGRKVSRAVKKIAHFFLIYNGFPLPVLPGRSIQHSPLPENSGLMISDAA